MSPLAPLENGSQSFGEKAIKQQNPIERNPNEKFTYSMGSLYAMRHTESRAPNLGNRFVLSSISRPNVAPSMHNSGAFSHNIALPTMDTFQRGRRQLNHNRSVATAPRQHGNSNGDCQTSYRHINDERHRPTNRGKFESQSNICCCFFFVNQISFFRLCS